MLPILDSTADTDEQLAIRLAGDREPALRQQSDITSMKKKGLSFELRVAELCSECGRTNGGG